MPLRYLRSLGLLAFIASIPLAVRLSSGRPFVGGSSGRGFGGSILLRSGSLSTFTVLRIGSSSRSMGPCIAGTKRSMRRGMRSLRLRSAFACFASPRRSSSAISRRPWLAFAHRYADLVRGLAVTSHAARVVGVARVATFRSGWTVQTVAVHLHGVGDELRRERRAPLLRCACGGLVRERAW